MIGFSPIFLPALQLAHALQCCFGAATLRANPSRANHYQGAWNRHEELGAEPLRIRTSGYD